MPDVPTIEEAGIKGVILETWVAAFTPEKTPPEIIARISAEMHKAMINPAVGEKLAPTAYEPVGGSADEMAILFREDSAKYASLAKELNIKL
jgi:tripartite-type tricarboxylate transporter receptor subunit TctC